jgi:hypothetical protein
MPPPSAWLAIPTINAFRLSLSKLFYTVNKRCATARWDGIKAFSSCLKERAVQRHLHDSIHSLSVARRISQAYHCWRGVVGIRVGHCVACHHLPWRGAVHQHSTTPPQILKWPCSSPSYKEHGVRSGETRLCYPLCALFDTCRHCCSSLLVYNVHQRHFSQQAHVGCKPDTDEEKAEAEFTHIFSAHMSGRCDQQHSTHGTGKVKDGTVAWSEGVLPLLRLAEPPHTASPCRPCACSKQIRLASSQAAQQRPRLKTSLAASPALYPPSLPPTPKPANVLTSM